MGVCRAKFRWDPARWMLDSQSKRLSLSSGLRPLLLFRKTKKRLPACTDRREGFPMELEIKRAARLHLPLVGG